MTETTALPPSDIPPSDIPPTDHASTPLFVRPREGRMLAGVCAGIAQRWQLDVTLVRIVTVVLALLSGVGLAAYVAAWLLTPSVDGPAPLAPGSPLATSVTDRGGRIARRIPRLLLILIVAALIVGLAHSLWFGVPFGLLVVAGLLVLAFGTRLGRWAVAIFALLAVLAVSTVGIFGARFGDRSVHVTSVSDLQSSYDYGAGAVALDLSGLGAVSGEHHTSVHMGRGNVTLTVPNNVAVLVHARAGIGAVTINGHRVSGIDAEQTLPVGVGTATATDRLVVDVTVGVGSVKVRTA